MFVFPKNKKRGNVKHSGKSAIFDQQSVPELLRSSFHKQTNMNINIPLTENN